MSAKTRWFSAILLTVAVACSTQTTPQSAPTSSTGDPVAELSKLIQDLQGRGATDEDLRPLDQRLRLATALQKDGEKVRARALASEGLTLGATVNAGLEASIQASLEKMDVEIKRSFRDIRQDLTDHLEDRAIDRYEDVKKKIADRNARAAATQGRFPTDSFAEQLAPIEARVAAIREAREARNVHFTPYREKFRDSVMRVRGNEPQAYQDGVQAQRGGDIRAAKQAYLAVLNTQPNYYKALFNLGILDLDIGNFAEAATRLDRAFEIGLTLDELDGWNSDFVPDPEPLIAAYHEIGQTARVPEVRARYERRKGQVEARSAARRAEQKAASQPAPASPAATDAAPDAAPTGAAQDACTSRPYAGKVQFVKVGLDAKGVEEIICAPQNKRMKGDAEYWYYPSGTVIFISGKVDRTSTDQVTP